MNKKIEHSEALATVNQKILADGEKLPPVKLKDGSVVQTGTVATMLHNIELFNQCENEDIKTQLLLAIPTLIKVGLFDLFSPDEWLSKKNAGRNFVGINAKITLSVSNQKKNP